jgi:hypothetical protein
MLIFFLHELIDQSQILILITDLITFTQALILFPNYMGYYGRNNIFG